MITLFTIRDAVKEARLRTGDRSIGTQLEQGRLQVIRVTYTAKGTSTISPITGWLAADAALAAINAL